MVRVRVGARIRVRVGVRVGVRVLIYSGSTLVLPGTGGCGVACAGAIWASSLIESAPSSSPAPSSEEGC
eukprot:scaffold53007_cov56-Phaeocystis_antarctica.AAC.1